MKRTDPEKIDRAVRGALGGALSNGQKKAICILANAAWVQAGRPYYEPEATGPFALTRSEALELWRHEAQHEACGKRHLTACCQQDYLALRGHFRELLGMHEAAAEDLIRHHTSDRSVALSKLRHECKKAADVIDHPWNYVCGIAKARYKDRPENLTDRQMWVLVFDLRRNAQRRRAKT